MRALPFNKIGPIQPQYFNGLRQNCRYFTGDYFKFLFLNIIRSFKNDALLRRFVPKGRIDDKLVLVQAGSVKPLPVVMKTPLTGAYMYMRQRASVCPLINWGSLRSLKDYIQGKYLLTEVINIR